MATPTGTTKESFWLNHIRRWLKSKIGVRDYCDHHRLAEGSFYRWRRTLALRGLVPWKNSATATSATPAFVSVQVATLTSSTASSTAMRSSASSALEVVLGNGRVVRVPTGFDAETLRRLVGTLEERTC